MPCGQRVDTFAGDDLSPQRTQMRPQRVRDPLRASARDGPAESVRGDRQTEQEAARGIAIERDHAVRRHTREHRPRALLSERR